MVYLPTLMDVFDRACVLELITAGEIQAAQGLARSRPTNFDPDNDPDAPFLDWYARTRFGAGLDNRRAVMAIVKQVAAQKSISEVSARELPVAEAAAVLRGQGTVADGTDRPNAAELMERFAATLGGDTGVAILAIAQDKSKSADQRQRDIFLLDNTVIGWDGGRWALVLGCSAAAARKTSWWTVDRHRLRGGD